MKWAFIPLEFRLSVSVFPLSIDFDCIKILLLSVRCISVNMLVLAIVFISSNLMYHIVMKSMVLCPPLPNSLVNYLANPFISKLLCIGQVDDQTSPSFADEEAGEGNENTFDHGNVPKTVVKEWLLIIQYIDRVLLLVYVITLIIYHT